MNNEPLKRFVASALVGTQRKQVPFVEGDTVDDVVSQLPELSTESALLLRSGMDAIAVRSGMMPVKVEQFALSENDPASQPTRQLVGILRNALTPEGRDLLPEFVRLFQAGNISFPHVLLPELLSISDPVTREMVRPVIGRRGAWLAAMNPDWEWATQAKLSLNENDLSAMEVNWNHGSLSARERSLELVRQTHPDLAREWLSPGFSKEKPAHRLRFLEVLRTGLSNDDHEFLESTVSDRSDGVRLLAAQLLAMLPGSQLSQRMEARASDLLIQTAADRIECRPPEILEKAWKADGIPAKIPENRGKRAFWAESLIAMVRPSFWAEQFQAAPEQLITAVADDPFSKVVLSGWTQAAIAYVEFDETSSDWFGPLWDDWHASLIGKDPRKVPASIERLQTLVPYLPGEHVERGILQLLSNLPDPGQLPFEELTASLRRPWGMKFAKEYLRMTRQLLNTREDNLTYQWSNTLRTAGQAIPVECFDLALAPWTLKEDAHKAFRKNSIQQQVDTMLAMIYLRKSFHSEMNVALS